MFSIKLKSSLETKHLGELLGSLLQPGDIVTLNGELGAGKTCMAKGIAVGLGISDHITSPTFTLINEYTGKTPLFHMDVYRLGTPDELEDLGYEEYFYGQGVTLIEWAGLIEEYLPPDRLDIFINKPEGKDEYRQVYFVAYGSRFAHIVKELKQFVHSGD
ncbi:tRNA threonylcarbamoyladenosine biosynthesis protein TsaE [Desulfotomaculum arcticum]|uniref:tRNA threonylcarbamoyladenosine biosynthesis protein TsaE n=1 Tax=Desulfotruncus arcticus DSM 17038 TaxID=1121424 RepID=A0A1I2NBK3_9FIRM|nr:tRNA (adenosine(37)-N6)-threonylcarbamoyltransferase complex ATPase subunit type 1 TsaE [Desulfotruncus arcticus]SFF98751.1 tRNA threonylcarbamoyladenosine biosynthesis protein TsaE [Desulfotomaculum arcticum] [Desulfotruncus arcticus DSM 17038]